MVSSTGIVVTREDKEGGDISGVDEALVILLPEGSIGKYCRLGFYPCLGVLISG